jgi:hypothetical protein
MPSSKVLGVLVEKPDGSIVFVNTGEKRETKLDSGEDGGIEEMLSPSEAQRLKDQQVSRELKDILKRHKGEE